MARVADLEALQPDLRHAILSRCARQAARRLVQTTGSLAVGFGRRQTRRRHRPRGEWCLKFYVPRKVERPAPARLPVPKVLRMTATVDGVRYRVAIPTDVVSLRGLAAHARPAPAIFNAAAPAELGCACAEVAPEAGAPRFLLTAGHVAARNREVADAPLGETVLATGGLAVGALAAAPAMGDRSLDAALVRLEMDALPLLPRWGTAVSGVVAPGRLSPGQELRLLARRAARPAFFVGVIQDLAVEGVYAAGRAVFRTLLHCQAACRPGDSGAALVDQAGRLAGMHVMGTSADSHPDEYVSLAVPIGEICDGIFAGGSLRVLR